jgi:hypothetical protein
MQKHGQKSKPVTNIEPRSELKFDFVNHYDLCVIPLFKKEIDLLCKVFDCEHEFWRKWDILSASEQQSIYAKVSTVVGQFEEKQRQKQQQITDGIQSRLTTSKEKAEFQELKDRVADGTIQDGPRAARDIADKVYYERWKIAKVLYLAIVSVQYTLYPGLYLPGDVFFALKL